MAKRNNSNDDCAFKKGFFSAAGVSLRLATVIFAKTAVVLAVFIAGPRWGGKRAQQLALVIGYAA